MSLLRRGERFQDPNLGNSSPWIYVWNLWSLSASVGFIALRLWVRRMRFGLDDLLNTLAFIAAVASNATVFSALGEGLGNPLGILDQAKCSSVASLVVTSICLLFITDFLSKCSTLLLARRVITHGASPRQRERFACDALLAVCLAWVVIALGLVGSDCTTHCSLDSHGVCPSGHRVLIIVAISTLLELAIFALPVWLFANLRMSLVLKLTTLGLFAIRLPLAAFSIVYLVRFPTYMRSVDAGAAKIGGGVYWQSVLLASAVVAPSLQALKSTAELFNTSGAQVHPRSSVSIPAGSGYRLHDLSSASGRRGSRSMRQSRRVSPRPRAQRSDSESALRSDLNRYEIGMAPPVIEGGADSMRESWASGSGNGSAAGSPVGKMVIRQQMDWDVIVEG